MTMILTDVHTHTSFSPDGEDSLDRMVERAEALGISYYGIAEHFDYDYLVNGIPFGEEPAVFIDEEAYFKSAREAQRKAKLCLLVGGEFGFTTNPEAHRLYQRVIERYRPDFVVNSVHTNGRGDYYFPQTYRGRTREETFSEYLSLVKKSLAAPYSYDIVAHFCYPVRYAPYEKREITLLEYGRQIDEILREIIERDKILEVNSSAKGAGELFLPGREIVARYFALGGRKVSFASDAHDVSRILERRETIVRVLREIGFTEITVPVRGKHLFIPI